MPASEESPKMLYIRIEERLAPLLRTALAEHLPEIGGDDWWKSCVIPALTSVQSDHLRPEPWGAGGGRGQEKRQPDYRGHRAGTGEGCFRRSRLH